MEIWWHIHIGILAVYGYLKRKTTIGKIMGIGKCTMESVGRLNNEFDISFYKGKKVLITGHTGFKGAWLCKMLSLAGAKVTGYALEPPTTPSLFEIAEIAKDVDSIIGDIRDYAHLKMYLMVYNRK